jgi:ribosomal protein L11 methylase PrmA
MDAQAILTKIEQDAREAAEKVLSDAREKTRMMKLEAQAKMEAQQKTMLRQAEQDCVQMEERMLRMADLEDRKQLLKQKRDVIDQAFQKAKEALEQTEPARRRAFFLAQAVRFATGTETLIIGMDHADWFDESFLADANAALQASGKPGNLQLSTQRRKGCAGLILALNGAEVRITFEALVEEARTELEQSAAQTLFT